MSNSTSDEEFKNDLDAESDNSNDEGISGPKSMFSFMKPYHVPGSPAIPHQQHKINSDSENNEDIVGKKRKPRPAVPPKPKKKFAQDVGPSDGAAQDEGPSEGATQDVGHSEGAVEKDDGKEEQAMGHVPKEAAEETLAEGKQIIIENDPALADSNMSSQDFQSNFTSYVMIDGENLDKNMRPEADQDENDDTYSSCSDSYKSSLSDAEEEEFKDTVDDMTPNKDVDDRNSTPVGDEDDTAIGKEDKAPETLEDESNKEGSTATSEELSLSFVVLGTGDTFRSISNSISEGALENQDTLQIPSDPGQKPVDNDDTRQSGRDADTTGGNAEPESQDIVTEIESVERRPPKEDRDTEEVEEKRLSVKDRIKMFQDNSEDLPKRMSGKLIDSKSPSQEKDPGTNTNKEMATENESNISSKPESPVKFEQQPAADYSTIGDVSPPYTPLNESKDPSPVKEDPCSESNETMAQSESNNDSNPESLIRFELQPPADDSTSAESFMIPETNDFEERRSSDDTDGEEDDEETSSGADDPDDVSPPCTPRSSSSMEDERGVHDEATHEVDSKDVSAVSDTEEPDTERNSRNLDALSEPSQPTPLLPKSNVDTSEASAVADAEDADTKGEIRNLNTPSEPPPPLPPKSEKVYESMASFNQHQTSPETQQSPPQSQQYQQYYGPYGYGSMPQYSYQQPQYMLINGELKFVGPYMYPQQYTPQQPDLAYGYSQPQESLQAETAPGLGAPFLSQPVTEPARLSPRAKSPVPRVESPAPTGTGSPRTISPHVGRKPHKADIKSDRPSTPTGRPGVGRRQSEAAEKRSRTKDSLRPKVQRNSSSPARLIQKQDEKPAGKQRKDRDREPQGQKKKGTKSTPTTSPEVAPSPVPHYIIVSNLDKAEEESYDNLSSYIEVGSGVTPVLDKIIYNRATMTALLVLDGKPDMVKLRSRIETKHLYGNYVTVQALDAPKAIAVSCEEDIAKESLELYFESNKSGGGPMQGDVEDSEDKTFFIIRYKDPANVTSVCNKHPHHHFENKSLRVSPYYEYSGGAIWDTHLHTLPIPGPVKVELSTNHGTYLQRHCEEALRNHLKDQHCTFTIEETFVELTCTLHPGVEDFRRRLKVWSGAVQAAVQGFKQDNVEEQHLEVLDGVWDDLVQFLQSDAFDARDIVLKIDKAQRKVTFTGASAAVNEKLAAATVKHNQIDRAHKKEKATKKFETYDLELALPGVKEQIMKLQTNFVDAELKLTGATIEVDAVPEDKDQIYVTIFETLQEIQRHKIGHTYSEECVDYASSNEAIKTNIDNQILHAGIEASWRLEKYELNICVTEGDYGNVRDIVFDIIEEQSMTFEEEDCGLLHDREWSNFQDDLTERFDKEAKASDVTFNGKKGSLMVYGLAATVKEIVKEITNFIKENGVRKESIDFSALEIFKLRFLKKHRKDAIQNLEREYATEKLKIDLTGETQIRLTATRTGIELGERAVRQLLDKIVQQDHTIQKVAVAEVCKDSTIFNEVEDDTRCLIKLPEEFEQITSMAQAPRAKPENVRLSGAYFMGEQILDPGQSSGGFKVSIVRDEIAKQKADILVAATSTNLKLGSGAAGKNLLQVGGESLQMECETNYPNGIQHWDIAVINGGKLRCSKVYLTSLQTWSGHGSKRNLKKVITDCLKMASQHSKEIISFAAMGTGQLKYPALEVASAMFQAVNEFKTKSPSTSLKEVRFVLHPKDKDTIGAFTDAEQHSTHGGGYASRAEMTVGPTQIQLVVEKIEEQKVDCLLVATNESLNMNSGACKALLQKGGTALQDECKSKYGNHLKVGQVGEIGAGNLPCKAVFLTVLPPKERAEEELEQIVTTFLGLVEAKNYTSAAIPALGTGYLKYPKDVTSRGLYNAVASWAKAHPKTCLKKVRFVMFEKDTETIEVFQKQFEHRKGSGKGSRKFDSGHHHHHHHKHGPKFPMTREAPTAATTAKNTDTAPSAAPSVKNTDSGCQIRQTILKVQMGDILESDTDAIVSSCGKTFNFNGAVAQMMIKNRPGIVKECHKKKDKFESEGLAVTGSHGLKAKNIVHVQFQESLNGWKKIMVKSLEKADKKRWRTISFPVLGSGAGHLTFKPDCIAEQLFEAVDEFTKKAGHTSVKDVRLVIFHKQPDMFEPVLKAIHRKANSTPATKIDKVKGLFSDAWDNIKGVTKGVMTADEQKDRRQKMSSMSMSIYSDSFENIKTCITRLDERLEREYTTKKIEQDVVKSLTKEESRKLNDIESYIDLRIDASTGIITIQGPLHHVSNAQSELQNLLRNFEKDRHETEQAETLHKQVIWYYEEITPTEAKLVEYDKRSNLTIEMAYNRSEDRVELMDIEGNVYIIDFKKLVEYEKGSSITTGLRVVRKDVLKSTGAELPADWEQMAPDENVKILTLPPSDQRYKDIEKRFLQEVNKGKFTHEITFKLNTLKVLKIEKIQNKALFQQYHAKKKLIESQKAGLLKTMPIERDLWHGTNTAASSSIKTHGFNRSYCGDNSRQKCWYGDGVYFAGDASYSAKGWLSGADRALAGQTVKGCVFLVKVLTGQLCQGVKGMRFLKPVDPNKPDVLYDSAVNKVNDPFEFVIFHDTQCYPDYLLEFSATNP